MSEKPEALRLAENLVNQWWGMTASPSGLPEVSPVAVAALRVDAADKLIRQHAEIERLKAALPYDWDQLEACRGSLREHMAEIKRLKAENERLREALKLALNSHGRMLLTDPPQDPWKVNRVEERARAVLLRQEVPK